MRTRSLHDGGAFMCGRLLRQSSLAPRVGRIPRRVRYRLHPAGDAPPNARTASARTCVAHPIWYSARSRWPSDGAPHGVPHRACQPAFGSGPPAMGRASDISHRPGGVASGRLRTHRPAHGSSRRRAARPGTGDHAVQRRRRQRAGRSAAPDHSTRPTRGRARHRGGSPCSAGVPGPPGYRPSHAPLVVGHAVCDSVRLGGADLVMSRSYSARHTGALHTHVRSDLCHVQRVRPDRITHSVPSG